MVSLESQRLDSIGIVARKGETEPQHHARGKIIEDHYTDIKKELGNRKSNSVIQVSDSVPIEECGFDKPVMPVLHLDDFYLDTKIGWNSDGAAMPNKIDAEKNILYSLPVVKKSVKGDRLDVVKEHEELHCIRELIEDVNVLVDKKSRKDFLVNYFYNRRKMKELPVHLYGELPAYLTSDTSLKEEAKKFNRNFDTNTDVLKDFLYRLYTKPAKNNAIIDSVASGSAVGLSLLMQQIAGVSYFLAGYAAVSGARAVTKGCEYYKINKINNEFIETAELMKDLCRQTGYSLMPTVSRLGYKEIRPSLDGIKVQGVDNFFKEKIINTSEGFRWEIMYEKTLNTKDSAKCEL